MRHLPCLFVILATIPLVSACADDPALDGDGDTSGYETAETETGEEVGTDTDPDTETDTDTGETGEPIEPPDLLLCGTEAPAGAELAPALPSYAGPGSCPTLETGTGTLNVMQTDHGDREFFLVTPSDYQPGEQLPVIFMYHWLGGDAVDFYDRAEAQYAADYYGIIAIIPEGRTSDDSVPFRWPFTIADDQSKVDEEFAFHDDMLACVHEQFGVDKE